MASIITCSDEEIAWGPLTLREIKGDLKRTVIRKPSRRHTVHCSFEDSHKTMEESICEDVNQLDMSETSTTYLTPNESLQANGNNNFLEKLSQVISVPSSNLSEYASVLEDTENSDIQTKYSPNQNTLAKIIPNIQVTEPCESDRNESCMNFLKVLENRKTHYDIENFQQTLVDNTCILSDEEEGEDSPLNESADTVDSEEKSVTKEEVIVISDDSDSSVISNNSNYINYIESNISLKKENDLEDYSEQLTNDSQRESSLYESSFEQLVSDEAHYELEEDSGDRFSNGANIFDEENGQSKGAYNFFMSPNVLPKLSVIRESLSTSPVVLPEIDLAQFDESVSKDESFQLNDTVEEMKRAVCQGLNYSMSDDEPVDNTPMKRDIVPNETPHYGKSMEQTPSYSKEMRSQLPKPISTDKRQIKKVSPKINFKVPECKKGKTTPTPTKSCPSHLKNIVSPVALYIKSSPRFPLRQNVPEKELSRVVSSASVNVKTSNKENFPEFPEVVYKPSRNQIASNEKHIVIPSYMKKLNTREGQITKHEGKLHYELDNSKVSRKLLQTDITNSTIDQSLLCDTGGDISVLTNKQAFIKADYWKSQDRKYCDFCKCWIADNKPSVEFHEKGRRHQENVKKRLNTITKNSARTQRETEKVDATLKQMEAAAMAAYRRDVEANSNADLTSIAISNRLKEENLSISESSKKVWHEAKSKEGHTYYWNILTNETSWEPPKEGYLSLQEQREGKDIETGKQLKEVDKLKRIEGLQRMQIQKQEDEEERARLAREKMKERRVESDIPEPVYGPIIDPGKNDPYGKWETIKERENVDLQLPIQQQYFECPVVVEPEPVVKEFKEKTVESLAGEGESSSFRKRKIGSWAKKNTRQRLNDD